MPSTCSRKRNVFEPSRSIKEQPRQKEKNARRDAFSEYIVYSARNFNSSNGRNKVKKVMICYNSFKASSESIGATMEMSGNSLASSGVGIVNRGSARNGSSCRVSGSLPAVASSQRMTRMEMKPHSSLSRPI